VALLRSNWEEKIRSNFEEASAEMPTNVFARTGGKTGLHSEHLGFMLAELQYLQRSFPGCEW
jgi:ring-1,2-phenylacetyl-CoA epoxidase subunit PaaC